MGLTQNQCRGLVYNYFLVEGWLPSGTTASNWDEVIIEDLGLDDPPLPSDPHMQKTRVALDIKKLASILGFTIVSPISFLKNEQNESLGALAISIFNNQES